MDCEQKKNDGICKNEGIVCDSCKPSPASDGYALGDKVRLLKDIWDDGEDHHPPCYLAYKDEVLIVRRGQTTTSGVTIVVSHEHRTDNGFVVTVNEVERA